VSILICVLALGLTLVAQRFASRLSVLPRD
jgi:hypothetical protein